MCLQLKRSLSEEFNRKMTGWSAGRGGRRGWAELASPNTERQLTAEFRKKLEEWQRIKGAVEGRVEDEEVQVNK